jgi:hypothetical protein
MLMMQLLPIVLEQLFAVAAPPSGHSLFTNNDIVKKNVPLP